MGRRVISGLAVASLAGSVTIALAVLARASPGNVPTPADAARSYNSKCLRCHGRDGRSRTAQGRRTRSRDLTSGEWQDDVSDERIFNSISSGRGKMPGFKKSLTENQIEELVHYVRRLRR